MTQDAQDLALAMVPVPQRSVYGTDQPVEIMRRVTDIAGPLSKFIKQSKMSTKIQGREYVLAEGWSFLGSLLGVFPVTTSVAMLHDDIEFISGVGFEATVELRTRDGAVVGGAIAECTRHEKLWATRDDYALKSMAQTRAMGKAYRMAFGFVMKAAGYEATPAEEMPPNEDFQEAQREMRQAGADRPRAGESFGSAATSMARAARAAGKQWTLENVGQLLNWAKDTHQLTKQEVCGILGIADVTEIKDFAAAQARLQASMSQTEPVLTPDGAAAPNAATVRP